MVIAALLPEAGGPHAIGWVMVTLAALALTLERVMALIRGFRRSPAVEDSFISKVECGIHHNALGGRVLTLESRMDRVERKMEADKVEIIHATQELSNNLNNRINTLLECMSELRGEIKHLTNPNPHSR